MPTRQGAPVGAPTWIDLATWEICAQQFYGNVFGWQIETVSDSDEFRYSTAVFDGDPTARSHGRDDGVTDRAPSNWYFFLGSDDVDKTVALVEENGGTVVRGAEDTPYGRLAAVADPIGAGFNLSSLDR